MNEDFNVCYLKWMLLIVILSVLLSAVKLRMAFI